MGTDGDTAAVLDALLGHVAFDGWNAAALGRALADVETQLQRILDADARMQTQLPPVLVQGETGTGKTSAALALANALGCDLSKQEFGGVYVIASGEQSADSVRETCRMMHNAPWHGSGWKVVIVNEADRMSSPAETVWLDRLEALPPKTVVIFTTNYAGKLSQRFVDRCTRLTFESGAEKLRASATQFASAIWKAETRCKPDPAKLREIIKSTEQDGQISFRRLIQALTVELG